MLDAKEIKVDIYIGDYKCLFITSKKEADKLASIFQDIDNGIPYIKKEKYIHRRKYKGADIMNKKSIIANINKSIKHWERMINWAKSRPLRERTDDDLMLDLLGERWLTTDCNLCKTFRYEGGKYQCENCPLTGLNKQCEQTVSPWRSVDSSKTWKTWISNAEQYMIPALEESKKLYKE